MGGVKVLSSKKILAVQYKSPMLLVGHPAETGNLSKIVPLERGRRALMKGTKVLRPKRR